MRKGDCRSLGTQSCDNIAVVRGRQMTRVSTLNQLHHRRSNFTNGGQRYVWIGAIVIACTGYEENRRKSSCVSMQHSDPADTPTYGIVRDIQGNGRRRSQSETIPLFPPLLLRILFLCLCNRSGRMSFISISIILVPGRSVDMGQSRREM